jgi:subtilisin family serine protease
MNYNEVLRLLKRHGCAHLPTARRHLIRFRSRKEFRRFITQLKAFGTGLAEKAGVLPISIMDSVICTLSHWPKHFHHRGIRYVEEDALMKVHFEIPNPTAQSHPVIPWGIRQIRAHRVWHHTIGSAVRIGVIDTGADFRHPDLKHALAHGVNLLRRGELPIDDNGHGTHISGTIAAYSSSGIVGTAPGAILYPVKAFDRNGSAYVSDIVQGIDWCVRHGIRLINMSFGMKQQSRALRDAVKSACRAGAILVCSAGNDGSKKKVDYPARYPDTISVGATDRQRTLARFTNRGKHVDIYAPGSRIHSTWPGHRYMKLSGTSMSTSHVTGALALALAIHPDWDLHDIRRLLAKASVAVKKGGKIGAREIHVPLLIKYARKRAATSSRHQQKKAKR